MLAASRFLRSRGPERSAGSIPLAERDVLVEHEPHRALPALRAQDANERVVQAATAEQPEGEAPAGDVAGPDDPGRSRVPGATPGGED